MKPEETFIVISRCCENDTSWSRKLSEKGFHIAVYDHENTPYPYFVTSHKGRESIVYFKYIIDYYHSLFPYTVFLHDKDFAWHHKGSIVNKILKTEGSEYKNLNSKCTGSILEVKEMPWFYDKFLKEYLGDIEKYGNWTLGEKCCAQFIVHRERIHKYPLKFYKAIYNWFLSGDDLDIKTAGHMLEWTYMLIFDNPFRDRKMTQKEYDDMMKKRKRQIPKKGSIMNVCYP